MLVKNFYYDVANSIAYYSRRVFNGLTNFRNIITWYKYFDNSKLFEVIQLFSSVNNKYEGKYVSFTRDSYAKFLRKLKPGSIFHDISTGNGGEFLKVSSSPDLFIETDEKLALRGANFTGNLFLQVEDFAYGLGDTGGVLFLVKK